jgi:hypothetical protein
LFFANVGFFRISVESLKMMNIRNLLIATFGLALLVSPCWGIGSLTAVAPLVKHVVPYDRYVWGDESGEVVVLVQSRVVGLVQELCVESSTGKLHPRSAFDTVHLMRIEPFLFEGIDLLAAAGTPDVARES